MIIRLDSEETRAQEPWIDKVREWEEDTDIIEVISKDNYIYHVIVDENGSVEVINVGVGEDPQEMPEIQVGDIEFIYLPSTDTNGNVIVEITTKIEGYRIQYRTEESGWTDYEEGIEYEKNGLIYARLASETSNTYVTKVAIGNVTNIDKLKPKDFNITGTTETNSITIEGSTEDEEKTEEYNKSGIAKYQYSKDNGATWEDGAGTSKTWTNLPQDTTYELKMKAIDNAGNETISNEITLTTGKLPTLNELEGGNITFNYTPNTWTTGNVTATISTSITGFTLQYSKDDEAWTNYTSGVEYTANGTIRARLTDGTNTSNVATGNITNIDKVQPNTFTILPTATTNSITCEVSTVTDSAATSTNASSGIAKIEYKLNSGGTYSTSTRSWSGLTQGTTHTVYVRATDNAGNTREVTKGVTIGEMPGLQVGNITFIATPSTPTTGSVTVTLSTNIAGYTLQYSKNGTTWTNYTSGITYTDTGIIYGRLTDGTNVTNVLTGNITNIDRLQPNTFTISPTSTTNSITCPVPTVTDAAATSTNGSSGIAKIEYKLNSGGTYSTSTRSWSGLTQGSTHTVYVRVTDNAGNTREVTKSILVGTVPGGTITITPSVTGYTNQNVTVTIRTSIAGYTLQYSLNGTSGWTNISNGGTYTFTTNGVIYARLYDGINGSQNATYTVTTIDKTPPNPPTITAPTSNITQRTRSITISWNYSAPETGESQTAYQIVGSLYVRISKLGI